MNIYIGSSFSLIPLVEAITEVLISNGHEITEKWWTRAYTSEALGEVDTQYLKTLYDSLSPEEYYKKPETRSSYLLDLQGIDHADAFILVSGLTPRKFNGANIELGYALAKGLLCLSFGELEKSVMYWDVIKCFSIAELVHALDGDPDW